jgi:hypothetical protein
VTLPSSNFARAIAARSSIEDNVVPVFLVLVHFFIAWIVFVVIAGIVFVVGGGINTV